MDTSSTTTISNGKRCCAWYSGSICGGLSPSKRCTVCPDNCAKNTATFSGSPDILLNAFLSASDIRAAALPVGATNAIRGCCSPHSNASNFATVVVLPVPGPPLMTVKFCVNANAAAVCWSRLRSSGNQFCNESAMFSGCANSCFGEDNRLISFAKSYSN